MNRYFHLYNCCIPTKGFKRSVICDLQRDTYMFIPNSLCDLIESVDFIDLNKDSNNYVCPNFKSYIELLIKNNYGFYTNDIQDSQNFKKIDLNWYNAKPITNAIIDIYENSTYDVSPIIVQLTELLCETLQIRIFNNVGIKKLVSLLKLTNNSSLRSIEIITGLTSHNVDDKLADIFDKFPRLVKVTVHSSKENKIRVIDPGLKFLIFTDNIINSETHCGIVNSTHFVSNVFMASEGKHFNTCLNRKIAVDKNGEIKNCPSLAKSYGNIRNTSLSNALLNKELKELWDVTKSMVDDCKICEFRMMCQDCRAYIKDPKNLLSKPLKCSYDPYNARWLES